MPSHSDQYHPQDAIGNAFKGGGYLGVLGLVGAAVKNSLAPQNIGAWGVFTKSGNIILTSAATGFTFEFVRSAMANLREKDDATNTGVAGFLGGAILGLASRSMPKVIGAGAACATVLTVFDFTGGSLKGYSYDPDMDDFDRKEKMINNRRRPLEETLAEIGEGRGIKPPGYEERRRARLKERYGIDIKTVSADVQ